ncbi:MAG TPA: hypothetical protein VH724_06145 [Candidatus Angelobacter sp.]|nr:hypothetical protein [Candidatus Angelobacter sp.]
MTKRLALVALLIAGTMAVAQAKKPAPADPWVGEWKLDTSKSKFHNPGPKEETLTVDSANNDAIKFSMKGTDPAGAAYTEAYEGKPDGKAYPLTRNGQEVAKISYHRNSDHNSTGSATVADGSTFTESVTLSKDGKTIIVKQHHKAKAGEYNDVIVFTK